MNKIINRSDWITHLYTQMGCPYFPDGEQWSIKTPDYIRVRRAIERETFEAVAWRLNR